MTGFVIDKLHIAFFLLGLASPFLPLALMWRVALLAFLSLLAADLIQGPVAGQAMSIGYVFGRAIIVMFALAVAVALAIRIGVAAKLKHLTWQSLAIGAERDRWLDRLITAFFGCIVGFLFVRALAAFLDGSGGGHGLDFGIGLALAAATVLLALWRPRYVTIPLLAACATSSTLMLLGAGQTGRILSAAEEFAAGRPWCLVAPAMATRIPALGDLGFLSLPKDNDGAHLIVLVRHGEGFSAAHWSIRRQQLRPSNRSHGGMSCHPRTDHAEALKNGEVDSELFAVGPKLFRVPATLRPWASTERLSVDAPLLIDDDTSGSRLVRRIDIDFGDRRFTASPPVYPLAEIASGRRPDADTLMKGGSRTYMGTDPASNRTITLRCLAGAYSDRQCNVIVSDGAAAYSFYLPFDQIEKWPEASYKVISLFDAMQATKQP